LFCVPRARLLPSVRRRSLPAGLSVHYCFQRFKCEARKFSRFQAVSNSLCLGPPEGKFLPILRTEVPFSFPAPGHIRVIHWPEWRSCRGRSTRPARCGGISDPRLGQYCPSVSPQRRGRVNGRTRSRRSPTVPVPDLHPFPTSHMLSVGLPLKNL